MKKYLKTALALGMAAVMLAGCGGGGAGAGSGTGDGAQSGGAAATDTAGGSGTLTFGCQNYSGGGVDPAADTNNGWNCSRYGVGECLFMFNDAMEVEYKLCDDYEVSDDHKTWTFHIRDGVKFSNGNDLTASAVVANFERLFEVGASGSAYPEKYLDKEAVLTADDSTNTVVMETVTAYPDLRKNLAYPTMVVIDVEGTTDFAHGTIGTGPYAIESFQEDVGYDLVKNEYYWGGEVPFDRVELLYMGDAQAKANALRSGQVDLVENITNVADLEALKADPNYTVNIANGVRCGFAYINHDSILKNDALRQAVLMGVDQKTMCEVTVGGLYTYGFSCLPSNLNYKYDTLKNPFPYDKDAAIKLLDDAGIVDSDGDGIRELDGENLNLRFLTYENRGLADLAAAAVQQLTAIGIGCTLNTMDSESLWNITVNGDYELSNNNWTTVGTGDPTEYLANWYGKAEANMCSYQNDEYDTLYEELLTEFDESKRIDIIARLQQILIDDGALMVHGYYNSSMISSAAIGNAPIHTADYYWLTTEITPSK